MIDGTIVLFNIDEFREFIDRTIKTYEELPNGDNGNLGIIEPLKNSTD